MIDSHTIVRNFWDMFIVDALVGNTDRHNGNWGFLENKISRNVSIAPIYDCGSCLNPMLEDNQIDGKKINYMEFISSKKNNDCNISLKKLFPKINIDEINRFIDGIDCISNNRKCFYKIVIENRYNIIKKVYNELVGEM